MKERGLVFVFAVVSLIILFVRLDEHFELCVLFFLIDELAKIFFLVVFF
jgi:hypothetical protein